MVSFHMSFEVVLFDEAEDFLQGLDAKLQAKAYRAIDLLKIFGPRLTMPHARKLIDFDLWELRAIRGNLICRLFYFYDKATIYVITSGYIKKQQKASKQEIQRALALKASYLRGDR
jgi:hypothetical protein